MNVVVEYLYRDAGNNKIWNETPFSNKFDIDRDELLWQVKNKLIDGEFFVAEKSGVTPLTFDEYDEELDHRWHEFYNIKDSNDKTQVCDRDITQFIDTL